ncbi:hypothetical protein [Pseudomonas sp. OTU750018]|uniref:hypothetical protein n=1 Tax=Pseudomonas sp. OTU750018 TaxID=2709708 RepID=UPI001420BC9E|nr:hypothetical protein [Pseudomonas sp. OTU750018]
MAIPERLTGNTWTVDTANAIIPLLVWCAKNRRTITYKHLDRELVRRGLGHSAHAALYGRVAGVVGDALRDTEKEEEMDLPPLNILVVNKGTRRPGTGCDAYFKRYTKGREFESLTESEQEAVVERATQDIFECRNWDALLDIYEMEPITGAILPEEEVDERLISPALGGFSKEQESEAHKALKDFVLNNPRLVIDGAIRGWKGEKEVNLPSGDRADVLFSKAGKMVAVEVKSHISNDADLSRGIFQCIKYKSVAIAWQRAKLDIPDARSVLVIQRDLPAELAILAERLSVEVVVIPTL